MSHDRLVDIIAPVMTGGPDPVDLARRLLDCGGSSTGRLLIVVDSPHDALAELARSDSRVVPIACEGGLTWAGRVALALRERRGDVATLAPGAVPTPGWLDPLARAARSAERVALVAPITDGDGFDEPHGVDVDRLLAAVAGLPDSVEIHRAGLAGNYLRGDVLDAVGPPDAAIEDPREAMDEWLSRALARGFLALRACRSIVLREPVGEPTAPLPVEGPAPLAADLMRRRAARHARTLDAALARHAVEVATSGRIRVALDLRHLPLEMNGTKMYALSLGKALAKLPEVELTMLAFHPLQAEGVEGRLVHPDDWADDVHVIHKPAQIFDPAHTRLLFESRAHVAVTHQDLIAYRMAEAFGDEEAFDSHRQTTRLVLPAMQAVLTPSAITAEEVRREFRSIVDPDAVHPVLEGGDLEEFGGPTFEAEADEALARMGISGPYFMAMASDYPHKNMPALLEAYAAFRASRQGSETPSLVLPGRAPRTRDAATTRGPMEGVRFLGAVTHRELRVLYQNALGLVFPSLYEGFGLPPLEAMAAGTPVAALPFTSVLEVCRGAALFAEGLAPADLARAMARLADEPELRRELREAGYRRVRELTWEKVARETVAVYREIILNPSERSLQARRSLSEAIILWATPPPAPAPAAIVEEPIIEPEPEPVVEPEPEPEPIAPPPPVIVYLEPEPMGILNASRALAGALSRRFRRDLARIAPRLYARLVRAKRLSRRFVQVVRSDGVGAAMGKTGRKVGNKARRVLRKILPARLVAGPPCPYFDPPTPIDPYDAWLAVNGPSPRRAERLAEEVARLSRRPSFSILTPVYNTPPELLEEAVRSVQAQSYEDWELILADDASNDPATLALLATAPWADPRVRVVTRPANGNISAATNTAAEVASGEWLVLLDHDDALHPEALARLAIAIDREPAVDMVYSDDDKTDLSGARFAPQFKPDWSPELLLSFCYTGHVSAVRASLYREVGGMRLGFEGSQDHDFWLRASEKARGVAHVPHILYHWRVVPGSTAASGHEKPHSFEAGRRAVEEAFARRGVPCRVEQPAWALAAGCGMYQPVMPDDGPSVAVVIPTKNQRKLLQNLLESLGATTYRNYRVYIIDNESDDPETLAYLATARATVLRIPNADGKFNYAAIHNTAVRGLREDLIVFLNNDVEVIEPRWLSQMVGWSRLPGVGSVGARLLYSDRRIQHAGIVHGLHEGMAGHAFKLLPWWDGGAMGLARVSRDAYAVTAACMITPRELFLEMGGFDEENFGVAYNDADYGYRLHDAGYRNVVCAEAELFHHEGATRGFGDNPREEANYRRMHGHRRDPYFSPHFDPRSEAHVVQPTVVPTSDDAPVRLLAVSHNLNWEGASRFELEMVAGLKATGGYEPMVVSPVDGPLRAEYEKAGIPIRVDASLVNLFGGPDAYAEARGRMVDLLRDGGFHALHANTLQSFWAIDAARAAGLPSVWSIHESEPWQTYYDNFPREIARMALESVAVPYRVVFSSHASTNVWQALDTRSNYGLIRFSLNAPRFHAELESRPREDARRELGIGDDEVCVLLLGTVCDRKGQHDLVHAFAAMAPETARKLRCVVVGARDSLEYSQELRRLSAALPEDRADRFLIVAETGETAAYWQAADVFCCSSRVESYPHVILEAMARGLPIVTTPVYGIPEQVRHDLNALVYHPGDVPLLTHHLETLANDPARRETMAAASPWVLQSIPSYADEIADYARLIRAAAESAAGPGDPDHREPEFEPAGATTRVLRAEAGAIATGTSAPHGATVGRVALAGEAR
ncbi:glycosyltransferase [Paludisphaera sp.]|uniref:glycosyltransferase n=1 Tax=Paludisphaera sp. TaxID=2017432 RepID=UPI00301BEAC5